MKQVSVSLCNEPIRSCNSCYAKNYGTDKVKLFDLRIGSMVNCVCGQCLKTLSRYIDDVFFEVMDVCPVCGHDIDPKDGEDKGRGELYLYWKCKSCGTSGAAVIDQHDNNAFTGHEILL